MRTRRVEVNCDVIENGKARLCRRPGCGRMWTLHAFGAWPAGAHPDRNDVGAGWTICGGDWPDGRRLAPDGGRVRHPFLAVWRADTASLAADRDLLGSSRLRTFPFSHSLGLGVRGSAVLVGLLSHRGTPVPRRLRGRGVSQPPLPAALHGLLPAQCHRPGRASLYETVNAHDGSGYAWGKPEAARSERSMPAACRSRVHALAVHSPPSTRHRRRSRL